MSHSYYVDPQVTIRVESENSETDGVRVTLEWTQENRLLQTLYSYSISVNPLVATLTEGTRVQLKVPYDTPYNVSILALLCG